MFPEDPRDPRLIDEAEELLDHWPLPERDVSDWEALAKGIDARIRITQIGATPDYLLEAPLPEEREVQRRSHPRMKRPVEGNLAALAKASVASKHEEPDSERDAMALSLLSLAVKARTESRSGGETGTTTADSPPEATVGLSALVNAPQRPFLARRAGSLESKRARHSSSAASQGAADSPQAVAATPAVPSGTHETRRMWLGIAFGVLGMAAAGIMYVSANRAPRSLATQAIAAAPEVAALPAATVQPESAPTEGAAETANAINVEDVPLAETKPTVAMAASSPRAARAPTPQAPAASPHEAPKTEPAAPAAPPSVGPSEPGMVMADSRISLPDRPSTGALQAAVGTVMGAARACVAGQEGPSRATVHFGSDGHVQQVSVSGPAVGTAAEPCMRSALGAARVQPFSRSSYSVSLTIRPN